MGRRRRKKTGPPRCRNCRAVVVFFRGAGDRWRSFDPKPVDGRTYIGPAAAPVLHGRAWMFTELLDELQALHQYGRGDAIDEAYDLPWHVPHTCPTSTAVESEEVP